MKERSEIEGIVNAEAEKRKPKTKGDFNWEEWKKGVMAEWTTFVNEVPVGTKVRHRWANDRTGVTEDGGYYDSPIGGAVNVSGKVWGVTLNDLLTITHTLK